ncbi:MAG: hypothetical protein U0174_22775 [Polyangiaceae bacterium]
MKTNRPLGSNKVDRLEQADRDLIKKLEPRFIQSNAAERERTNDLVDNVLGRSPLFRAVYAIGLIVLGLAWLAWKFRSAW